MGWVRSGNVAGHVTPTGEIVRQQEQPCLRL